MSEDIIALSEALERVQDDNELLLELFDIFLEDFMDKRQRLNDAVAGSDFNEIKNIAHSIKGASSNISAKKLYESLAILEQLAVEEKLKEVGDVLKVIDKQYDDVKNRIEEYKQESKQE